jgi:hypothetical protein
MLEVVARRVRLRDLQTDPEIVTRAIAPWWVSHLEGLIERKEQIPPPLVTDTMLVVGGHHTVEAWKRALGDDGEITVNVISNGTHSKDDLLEIALRENRNHGRALTAEQVDGWFWELVRVRKWRKQRAMDVLGISWTRAERLSTPRVVDVGKPNQHESSKLIERAMRVETPRTSERAIAAETPTRPERAMDVETPNAQERAYITETPRKLERAPSPPLLRAIEFHASRLLTNLEAGVAYPEHVLTLLTKLAASIKEVLRD